MGLIQISKFREPEPEDGDRHVALRTQRAVHRSAARRNAAQVFSIEAEAGAERASKARTGKLIRMLASPQDAEVVNAARALQRHLKADGKDLNDLANTLENA